MRTHAEPQSRRGKKIHAEARRRGGLCRLTVRRVAEKTFSARFARQLRHAERPLVSAPPRLRVNILCVSAALRAKPFDREKRA